MAGLATLIPSSASGAKCVTLGWDGSPGASGYNVYYGAASGIYTNMVVVSGQTSATITGLQEGATYYFAVTARDAVGLESLYSSELGWCVPEIVLSIAPVETNGTPAAVRLTAIGGSPERWTLERSSNLLSWTALARGTNVAVDITVGLQSAPRFFFRLANR